MAIPRLSIGCGIVVDQEERGLGTESSGSGHAVLIYRKRVDCVEVLSLSRDR